MNKHKNKMLGLLLLVLIIGVLTACSPEKPDNETIMQDISSNLKPREDHNMTRSFDNIKEDSLEGDTLVYSFDVYETRETDYNPLSIPDYKLKQKYHSQYDDLGGDSWIYQSTFNKSEDVPVFEYLEEPDVDWLVDIHFPEHTSHQIIDSTLDLENGKAQYKVHLQYDGKYFSKVTEATFDLEITTDYDLGFTWNLADNEDEPTFTDISMDATNMLGRWSANTPNGSMSIYINEIADGEIDVHFESANIFRGGILETADTDWIGEQDQNLLNKFQSEDVILYFSMEEGSDYITFAKEKFYKR